MLKLEEELTSMEERLRRLKIEYRIFFNGNRKKPPEDLKQRLEKQAKMLGERSNMTAAQRFRYNTLLTRYYTYRNLWRRTLQEMERSMDYRRAGGLSDVSSGKKPQVEMFRISLSDPNNEKDKVRRLYDELRQVQKGIKDNPDLSYPQFEGYIASQTHKFRTRYGCDRVSYVITLHGGEVRFTASAENP